MTNITFQCYYCGKRITKYGHEAELLNEIDDKLREYRVLSSKTMVNSNVPSILDIVGKQAKCCEKSLILHTYPERGRY